jgi:NAD+ diphosphatase
MIGFTGSPLVRPERERADPAAMAAALAHPDARLLALDDYQPHAEEGRLAWLPLDTAPPGELALLGTIDGIPRFVRLDPAAGPSSRTPELFALLILLAPGEAGTYAAARSLADWHARHRFCANCGHATAPDHAGWVRRCPSCGAEHHPRTDPVVIMLAEHDGRVLLGRQPAFPPGRYSALAGFVEVGETLEDAVARELFEEAGVRVRGVRYLMSQPWPFPSQLMLACTADAIEDVLTVDRNELEDARWFSHAEVAAALLGASDATFLPPPPYAIAYSLLARWAGMTGM